jgi:CYTH domain-containing protein
VYVLPDHPRPPGRLTGGHNAALRHERRFLLPSLPKTLARGTARLIEERYLTGTRLRLRRCLSPVPLGSAELSLGQRVRTVSDRLSRMTLTEPLSEREYAALARLPADLLVWRRYAVELSGQRCAVDVFEGELAGLVLAHVEFASVTEAWWFPPPVYAVAEVTADDRFGEEALARTSARMLAAMVAGYGMLLR